MDSGPGLPVSRAGGAPGAGEPRQEVPADVAAGCADVAANDPVLGFGRPRLISLQGGCGAGLGPPRPTLVGGMKRSC